MPMAKEYHAIALWGQMMQSFRYYIQSEQAKAAAQNAPLDAIYEREGVWKTVSGLKEGHEFRQHYANWMARLEKGEVKPYYIELPPDEDEEEEG